MVSTRTDSNSTVEKKRLRDRRAQQKLRERRDTQIKQLEDAVAYCNQHHQNQRTDSLIQKLEFLEQQNRILLSQHRNIAGIVSSWQSNTAESSLQSQEPLNYTVISPAIGLREVSTSSLLQAHASALEVHSHPSPDSNELVRESNFSPTANVTFPSMLVNISTQQSETGQQATQNRPVSADISQQNLPANTIEHRVSNCDRTFPDSLLLPRWALVPVNQAHGNSINEMFPFFWHPQDVAASPDLPSPVDLLFGSRKNYLANSIHSRLRIYRLGECERLAIGWLLYVYAKWRIFPSKSSFENVPSFLWPVAEQLYINHEYFFDLILWPTMRSHLLKNHRFEDLQDAMPMMSCCWRVRWPFGQELLYSNDNDVLTLHDEFFKTFTCLEGWGMTSEFMEKYPELLEGIDTTSIRYIPF